jgi:hypothetical protein
MTSQEVSLKMLENIRTERHQTETVRSMTGAKDRQARETAMNILQRGKFNEYCTRLIENYHANDKELTQLMLRGALRTSYDSRSALLHFAVTAKPGAGKNDLLNALTSLLPKRNVVMYSSVTSKVLYYAMRVPRADGQGMETNPYHFKNKVIAITEVADGKSSGYSGLKAFSELDQFSSFTHSTTLGQKGVDLTVQGPRAIWVSSVAGIDDEQVYRRFLHVKVGDNSKGSRMRKTDVITDNLIMQKSIDQDPEINIAKAGFDLLFESHPTFQGMSNETAGLVREVNIGLTEADYSPSQLKQLYALAECSAVEHQFQRNGVYITNEDVLQAWGWTGWEPNGEVKVEGKWFSPSI